MNDIIKQFLDREASRGNVPATIELKLSSITGFMAYLGREGKTVQNAESSDIEGFLSESLEKNNSRWEYNNRLTHLKQFYNFLIMKELVLLNPCLVLDRFKRERKDAPVFSMKEIKHILACITDDEGVRSSNRLRDRAIIEMLYSTGMRVNELVNLDIDDVDMAAREVFIRHGKGGRERLVPVGIVALEALEAYRDGRYRCLDHDREALFVTRDGFRMKTQSVDSLFRFWKEKAGVDTPGNVHTLRHSCATHMLKGGAPISAIMRLLGHEGLHGTQCYTHVSHDDFREALP